MRTDMRIVISCVVGLAIAGAFAAAPRPVEASIDQARDRLFAIIDTLREKYPSLRDRSEYGIGTLQEGQTTVYRERFEAGTTYLVVAVGCDTAQDIDLVVLDGNNRLVTKDTAYDQSAGVVFEPRYTGTYVVGVNMAKTSSGDAAHYAYQVFYVESER